MLEAVVEVNLRPDGCIRSAYVEVATADITTRLDNSVAQRF